MAQPDGVEIAKKILQFQQSNDPFSVLSLAPNLPPVTKETLTPDARRNYMRLATLVHPDKILKVFDKATEAFQVLVKMFELISNPAFRASLEKKSAKTKNPQKAAKTESAEGDGTKKKKTAAKKKRKNGDEDGDSGSSTDDDDEEEEQPKTRTRRVVAGVRDHTRPAGCRIMRTELGCPNCKTLWMPDAPQQYTLVMSENMKIHCQLCLFAFGCATALHACGKCKTPFDYDASMYDSENSCKKCSSVYYFAVMKVQLHQIQAIRQQEADDEAARVKALERDSRHAARGGGGASQQKDDTASDEKLLDLVGQCIINSACPLCKKNVGSKHKAHVVNCLANPVAPKKTRAMTDKQFLVQDGGAKKTKKAAGGKLATKRKATKRNRDWDD